MKHIRLLTAIGGMPLCAVCIGAGGDKSAVNPGMDPPAKATQFVFQDAKKVWSCTVTSPYLGGENQVEVLLPDKFDRKKKYRVLYVLPVEAGIGGGYGDGLQVMRKGDVHNRHDLICVSMAFDTVPWFGAHATDPKMRHEDYIKKVVVPLIEGRYPTVGTREGRLLIGFSKSGWGAFSLILRNPDFFGYACSWDAPLMVDWPGNWGIAEHFGTKENFEKYRIATLLQTHAGDFRDRTRLVLLGYSAFGSDTRDAHDRMTALGVKHVYRNDLRVEHRWFDRDPDKGWEMPAVEALAALAGIKPENN